MGRGYVTSKSEDVVLTWELPVRGVIRTVAEHQIPKDALFDALNMRLRRGELIRRGALVELISTDLTDAPMGAFPYRSEGGTRYVGIGTLTTIQRWNGTAWATVTGGTAPAGGRADHFRATSLRISSQTNLVIVNGNGPGWLIQGDATTKADLGGSPPVFTDVIAAHDRIIGITQTTSRWSASLNVGSWPAANEQNMMMTGDLCKSISQIGSSIIVYKEFTLWRLSPVAIGSLEFTFRPDFIQSAEGPASSNARVQVDGIDYWFTNQGRVGAFDGHSRVQWIADGVWEVIQDDLNADEMDRAFVAYNRQDHELWCLYPRTGTTELLGLLIVNLPRPAHGLPHHAAFPGRLEEAMSAGVAYRDADDVDRTMMLGSSANDERSYQITNTALGSAAQDDGANFTCEIRPGLQGLPGRDVFRISSLEPFLRRGGGYNAVQIFPLSSNVLDTLGGSQGQRTDEDLTVAPVKGIVPQDVTGRFYGWRLTADSNRTIRYMGALARGRRLS